MKTKQKSGTKKIPKGITIDKSLDGKHNDEPLFKTKLDKISKIIKIAGIPNV